MGGPDALSKYTLRHICCTQLRGYKSGFLIFDGPSWVLWQCKVHAHTSKELRFFFFAQLKLAIRAINTHLQE